jgi:hypothetical protein
MRMKCSTELSWRLFVPEENSDENEVLTELSLGPFVPGENSDDCFLQVLLSAILSIASAYDSHQSFVQSPCLCAVIRLLCIHRAFCAVTRRRSSPGQGVSGLSLSRRNEGLEVGSR